MQAVFLGIIFWSIVVAHVVFAKNQCKAHQPLTLKQLRSAKDIGSYAKKYNLKTVDDLVCCLPKEYLETYIVGISSIAGQNGTPDSPRIIMFDKTETNKIGKVDTTPPPNFMLSFNGGKGHNSQPDSIEIAQYNKKKGELELLDLSFSRSGPKLSKINPSECMLCHGEITKDRGTIAPAGGPKYIFDPFAQWPRFAGGIQICASNKEENTLHNIYADKAISVISSEPRYRCLDKKLIEVNKEENVPSARYPKLFMNLASFENSNLPQEQKRQSKWLRSLPEFQKYKYFLFGYSYCTMVGSADISEWFPPKIVEEMFGKVKFDPRLKAPGDLRLNFSKALQEEWQKNLDKKALQVSETANPNFTKGFAPNYSNMACRTETPKPDFRGFGSYFNGKNFLLLNEMDHVINKGPGPGGVALPFRLFLDKEGYGTGMISTVMVSTNPQLLRSGATVSLADEPESSKIKKLFRLVDKDGIETNVIPLIDKKGYYIPIAGQETVCKQLKRLSLEQFQELSKQSPAAGLSKINKSNKKNGIQ